LIRPPTRRLRSREDGRIGYLGLQGSLVAKLEARDRGEVSEANCLFVLAKDTAPSSGGRERARFRVPYAGPRALGIELREHGRTNSDVGARVERVRELAPEGAHPRGGYLQKANEWPTALGKNVGGSREGLGGALGRRRRVHLRHVDGSVDDEVGIALACRLGDRTYEIVVREIEAAGKNGCQYVHNGVTVPRMSATRTGPNVRESKLLGWWDPT